MSHRREFRRIDFDRVAAEAARYAPSILSRWLPDSKRVGRELVARNPMRADGRAGSFKVNLTTGAWADFATGDRGGDLISLASYLFRLNQREAAEKISEMLGGFDPYE